MTKPKNPAAVALAKLRAKSLTPERRAEIARQGGKASRKKLTAKQRSESAIKAGQASAAKQWGKKNDH